jgi:hypothetical protein
MSADELTRAVNAVDLPALIAEYYPDSGARPGTKGDFKAVWRDEGNASGSVYRNTSNTCWLFKDHGTDEGGNALHFLTTVKGMTDAEAAAEVKRRAGAPSANGRQSKSGLGPIVATYDYHDAQGKPLFQVVRFDKPKDFRQRQRKGTGWQWNLGGVTPVLYRLPKVLEAVATYRDEHPGDDPNIPARFDPARALFIPEGEKDVHNLEGLGLTATCNPMGAGKWRDHYSEALQGAHVVLLPDNDDKGREHMRAVAYSLERKAASIRIVTLPGLEEKGDVTDWLTAGGTLPALLELVKTARYWYRASGEPLNVLNDPFAPFAGADPRDAETFSEDDDPWEDLKELPDLYPPVPSLPADMLPEPLQPWLEDIAQRTSLPLEFVSCPALVALGAVVGRTVGIHPKQHDDWLVVPNLWGGIVGPPGWMKSAAISEATKPLSRLAVEAHKAFEEARKDAEAERARLELEISALKEPGSNVFCCYQAFASRTTFLSTNNIAHKPI